MKGFILSLSLLLLFQAASATTIIVRDTEEVIERSPLVVDAYVSEVHFTTAPRSATGYASITLSISEVIKGNTPSEIIVRRYGVSDRGAYLFTNYVPPFEVGERIVVSLKKHADGYYEPIGLYNGTFKIVNGLVAGTAFPAERLIGEIRELLSNRRTRLSADVPRFDLAALGHSRVVASGKITGDGSHLGGRFVTFDESWNSSTINFYYNSSNAPVGTSTVTARIGDAFSVWNGLALNALDFNYAGTSFQGQTDNTTSVILWDNWVDGVYAQEFPNPYPGNTGPRTKTGSDIIFNTDYNTAGGNPWGDYWYFGSSPLSSRTGNQKDFADILVHELGHTLGLAHTSYTSELMYGGGYENTTVFPLRALGDGDKAGGVHQHPVQTLSGTLGHSLVLPESQWSGFSIYEVDGSFTASNKHIELEGDAKIEVSSGGTLTINSSTFYGGASGQIKVYGTLDANGTTFTASGGSWNGIYFAGGSDGHIDGGTIEKAPAASSGAAVTIANSSPTIENATIVATSGSSRGALIITSFSAPRIVDNAVIQSDGYRTIYISSSNPYLYNNGIINLDTAQPVIYALSAHPYLYNSPSTSGKNSITGGNYGIYATSNSVVEATNTTIGSSGPNVFCGQGTKNLYVASGSTIYATNNEWPTGSPTYDGTGTISWSPAAGSSSCGSPKMAGADIFVPDLEGKNTTDSQSLLLRAKEEYWLGNLDNAAALYTQLIEEYSTSQHAATAVVEMGALFRETSKTSFFQVLEELSRGTGPLQALALEVLVPMYERAGRRDAALDAANAAIALASVSGRDFAARIILFHLHFNAGRYEEAAQAVASIKPENDTEQGTIETLRWLVSLEYGGNGRLPESVEEREIVSGADRTDGSLAVSAYPNPFNPVTTFRYVLPESGHVLLTMYDITGKEVAVLIDGIQEAGGHEAVFNATSLPSGLYLYRIIAAGKVNTGSILYIK